MALERFIPKSPDIFIRNSQDFEVAKFGHLNTIVEYINNNSAKPAGLNGYVQFNNNSALGGDAGLFWDNVNKRLGVGTVIPTSELHIDGHTGFGASLKITTNKVNSVAYVQMISNYVTGFEQYQYGGPGWGWPNWVTNRSGGTAAAPTTAPNNYGLNEYAIWSYDGTGNGQGYAMMTRTSETWTSTAHGIYTIFSTVATGSTSLVERMRFSASGNITFNNASDTAKVSIKGSGSTSATTSLLVQNSAGTAALQVADNGNTSLGSPNFNDRLEVYGNILLRANDRIRLAGTSDGNTALYATGGAAAQMNVKNGSASVFDFTFGTIGATTRMLRVNSHDSTTPSVVVGNNATSVASAVLVAESTTQGFLAPRMTTVQRDAIASPATGLQVFNTTLGTIDVYDGTGWDRFGSQTLIRGAGSTSATTSLLVQNSAAAQSMRFTDDGALRIDGVDGPALGLAYYSSGTLRFGVVGFGGVFIDSLTLGSSGIISTLTTNNGLSVNTASESSMIQTRVTSSKTYAYVAKGSNGVNQFRVYDLEGTQIGAGTKEASAILQADSTTKGFLPPRMTTAQRTAIASPANGLIVFDTDVQNLCYRRDGVWVQATFAAV